jgi:hypothetical protein
MPGWPRSIDIDALHGMRGSAPWIFGGSSRWHAARAVPSPDTVHPRATTPLTTAGIGADLLPLLVDRSPAKHGRRLAGAGIPIGTVEEVERLKPDYLLILTWNLADEVIDQMRNIRAWRGRFVTPLPRLEVLD